MDDSWHSKVLMVIPSINGGSLLARMLPTLHFPPSSVVVIDQGSTDDTLAVCAANGVGVLQLGHPHTYTQACNIGAGLARERGCQFLCVANNDIAFRSDVMGAMYAAVAQDPGLAIVAPSQIVFDSARDDKPLAYRVYWNLEEGQFLHDTEPRDGMVQRLEADFCELTCALIRMSVVEAIGFLDDAYGFYHEDADFGFRLRKAGYSCAYLPNAQIEHYLSSTMSRDKVDSKADYIAKNKRYFIRKHLGFAVSRNLPLPVFDRERSLLNQGLQPYLGRYGLVASTAPEFAISHAPVGAGGYLYTGIEGGQIPERWISSHRHLGAIFSTSPQTRDLLARLGIDHCFHIPPGIDLDTFHPWGPRHSLQGEVPTILAVVHGQQYQLLRIVLQAWHRVAASYPAARLVLYGPELARGMARQPDQSLRVGNVEVLRYGAEQVEVHEMLWPRRQEALAELYRGADCMITGIRGEDSALAVLQSAACGVPCIAVDAAGTAGFSVQAAVATDRLVPDMPGAPVDRLVAQLCAVLGCSASERNRLVLDGLNAVRGAFTLRNTAMGLHHALAGLQIRRPSRVLDRLDRRQQVLPVAVTVADEATVIGRPRRGTGAARRITTFGRVTEDFGAAWQANGLLRAVGAVGKEVAYFVTHKADQASRLGNSVVDRFRSTKSAPLLPLPHSALLIGYIDAQLGLGQSLRGLALALSQTTIPFAIYPFGVGVEGRRSTPYMPELYDEATPRAVNIIEVSVGELATVFANVDAGHFNRSYNILRTYWELSKAPEAWRPILELIDELWVPNDFVRESFRTVFDRTVTIVPPCVKPDWPDAASVRPFGLDEGIFYFMFSFDYFSFPQRKNPFGVIRAFRQAFPDPSIPVGLVIKSTGSAGHFPTLRNELRIIAQDDDRICLIDESLTREEMLSLMAATDCYVSVHRSEGFGLGLVESMTLGKPVIATDYSGNTDFLHEDTGYPIPFTLVPLRPSDYIHSEGQVWADPDETACAAAMARVFTHPAEAAAKAQAAQRFVADHYSPQAVARVVEARLATIFNQQSSPPAA